MAVLTFNEGEVRDAVRKMRTSPAPAYLIRARVWDSHRISYDAAQRALGGLVDKGVLTKPKRGYYKLAFDEDDR